MQLRVARATHQYTKEPIMMLEGKQVCLKAFLKALGVTKKRYKKVASLSKKGGVTFPKKRITRSEVQKCTEAKAWMKQYFLLVGDRMPHTQRTHLPHFLTKKDIYFRMKRELQDQGIEESDIIAISTFYRLWKKEFDQVLIPQQSRFSKCDICTKFDQERMQSGGRCGFTEDYKRHLKLIEQERKKYYKHREKARTYPEKYMTIIIDGMDQSKTNIPQLTQTPKGVQGLHQLRTHLTGVLVHTRSPHGKLSYVFVDTLQYPHDCNLTIHVLLEVLSSLKDKIVLPPNLNLQLDNTCRENKNKYLLAFCELLVSKKIFKKVRINFLPVGHTHEDIDQLFSRISTQLKQKGAQTLFELVEQVSLSSTPTPVTSIIKNNIRDIRSWITPHISELHGHTGPHCYKFLPHPSDPHIAQTFYRPWSNDAWCTSEKALTILNEIPPGLPSVQLPTSLKIDLIRLVDDIPKFYSWMSSSAVSWWSEQNLDDMYTEVDDGLTQWSLLELQESRAETTDWPVEELPQPSHELQALFSAETAPVEVYTGSYRPPSKAQVIQGCDYSALKVGSLVAVFSEDKESEPWIGRIETLFEDELEVVWLEGKYSKSWKVAKTTDPKNKRKKTEWRDRIAKNTILLYSFELTASGHLRKQTITHLKKAYEEMRSKL